MRVPTIIVAGTGSGTGKTTVVCAIAAALARRGVDVRLFKAGPDYLDPTFHTAVTGQVGRNLDAWMTGLDGLARAFIAGTRGLESPGVAIVEGAMGLFDGRSPTSLEGSGAELAQVLGAPVLLVVDAGGAARSVVPVVEGFASHVEDVHVLGVIFNRVGSTGHGALLAEAMVNARTPAPVHTVGSLPHRDDLFLPSRHLGLMAAHVSDATRTTQAREAWRAVLADWASEHLDLDAILAVAEQARGLSRPVVRAAPVGRARIGIARDEAFHFYYPDNLDLLEEAGAELVPFSPLHDTALPEALDGLYVGGGYPEEHAAELSSNRAMRAAVADLCASGRPVYAECGGLMYLGERLVNMAGEPHQMVGALPLHTAMEAHLRTLGYREVTTTQASPLGPAGTVFRGHEFHYSGLTETGSCETAFRWTGRRGAGECGYFRQNVLATYIHAHWGSNPEIPRAFVAACARRSIAARR